MYADYVRGFGDAEGEHWIGLENMRLLTNDHGQTDLKIAMTETVREGGTEQWITYGGFRIGGGAEFYKLHLGPKTAGNAAEAEYYRFCAVSLVYTNRFF